MFGFEGMDYVVFLDFFQRLVNSLSFSGILNGSKQMVRESWSVHVSCDKVGSVLALSIVMD